VLTSRDLDRFAKAALSLGCAGGVLKQQQLPFQPMKLRLVYEALATFQIPQTLADHTQSVVSVFGH
jgi:hypothetical protein